VTIPNEVDKSLLKELILGIVFVWGSVLGAAPLAFGQDQEPNNTCLTAQDFGAVAFPFMVDGSLDTPPETPDVDFFKFTGTPGTALRVDLEGQATGKGTLGDPLLGLFDSTCNLIALTDDSETANSRLVFTIPANGIFVLAATSFPDFGFAGNGDSSGTYQLTTTLTAVIGSIRGRIVDAVTGEPLAGDAFPFTSVELHRCGEFGCFGVNAQPADSEGRFRFNVDLAAQPLEVGTYLVRAFASQYEQGQTDPFNVGEGEDRDVGDIPLRPFPAQFSEIRPCGDLPPEGGTCSYSVRITNRSTTALKGAIWSIVEGFEIGSLTGFTRFQTANPKKMTLRPRASRVVRFKFKVPSTVSDGASICAQVFFGQNRLKPFFNTVGQRDLFCISKGVTGFSVVPEKEAQKLLRQVDRRSLKPLKKK
jgi:hypothetical protein